MTRSFSVLIEPTSLESSTSLVFGFIEEFLFQLLCAAVAALSIPRIFSSITGQSASGFADRPLDCATHFIVHRLNHRISSHSLLRICFWCCLCIWSTCLNHGGFLSFAQLVHYIRLYHRNEPSFRITCGVHPMYFWLYKNLCSIQHACLSASFDFPARNRECHSLTRLSSIE